MFSIIEKKISILLKKYSPHLTICMGVDGKNMSEKLAIAVNNKGIISLARKFHHFSDYVSVADSFLESEDGLHRSFKLKGKIAYLAVCYDIFGISQHKIGNPKFDFIINLIHAFKKGEFSGDVDFARKGLAGAAKQWKVPAFASALFINRCPTNWPSGVKWNYVSASVTKYKYADIKIKAVESKFEIENGTIYLRHYRQ